MARFKIEEDGREATTAEVEKLIEETSPRALAALVDKVVAEWVERGA